MPAHFPVCPDCKAKQRYTVTRRQTAWLSAFTVVIIMVALLAGCALIGYISIKGITGVIG
jgi:hypothetical protein